MYDEVLKNSIYDAKEVNKYFISSEDFKHVRPKVVVQNLKCSEFAKYTTKYHSIINNKKVLIIFKTPTTTSFNYTDFNNDIQL